MKSYRVFKAVLPLVLLSCMITDLQAQTFSLANIPQHAATYAVAANCTVSISSSGGGSFQWQGSNINTAGLYGGPGSEAINCSDQTGLRLEMSGAGNGSGTGVWNNSITLVFTFPQGVVGPVTFNLFDFTEPWYFDGACNSVYYQDKATVTAMSCSGSAITPVSTANNGPVSITTIGNSLIVKSIRLQGQCLNEPVSVGTAGDLISQITVVYSNQDPPDNIPAPVCSPPRYGISQYQYIFIGNITATAPIPLTASASPNSICTGQGVNLTATGTGPFTWNPGGLTGNPVSVYPSSTTTYTVTSGSGTCTSSQAVTVTVTPPADAGITPAGPFCENDAAVSLTAVDAGGLWTGTGIINATNGLFDPATAGAGAHQIIYTISGACGDADTISIQVNASANADITPAGPYCVSEPALNLTAADAGGIWSGPGITNTVDGTFNPAVAGLGNHEIIYSISGSCGDADTITIQVVANADATISPAGPYCTGDTPAGLSAAQAGGIWSGTGITDPILGIFSPSSSGSGTFSIIYTIGGSCGDADTIQITVAAEYDASIQAAGPFCGDDAAVNLTAVDPGGTWWGTGITNAAAGTFDPGAAGPGSHTITYGIAGSCGDTSTVIILVMAAADAGISPAGPFCVTDPPSTLTSADPGGTWSGSGITDGLLGTFSPATAGAGTFDIIYSIPGSCGDADTIQIIVASAFDATILPAGPFCSEDVSVSLLAADPGGTWSGSGITQASAGVFDPAVSGAGTHSIVYSIPGNCGDTDTIDIVVIQSADATINNAGPFCLFDGAALLSAVQSGGTWSGSGIINTGSGLFDPSQAGVGSHQITYMISGNCGDTAMITITVTDQMDATISPQDPVCANVPAFVLNAADPGGVWSGQGITDALNGTFNPGNAGPGSHEIIYSISGQCGNSDTLILMVYALPVISASSTSITCIDSVNGTANLTISGGAAPYTVIWDNGESTTGITQLAPGTYQASVTDANTCTLNASVVVGGSGEPCSTVIPVIYVPNIFTPNGDENNDILYVRGQGVNWLKFYVYNRWGEKVFETTELNVGWDGTFRGNRLDNAVFVWYLEAELNNGESVKWKGNVTLSR